jgi:DNA-binding transcriptional LysR family regulator
MALTLAQLETIRRLAALGSFTRTADSLHVTQPAITQHVKALQEHFGTRLFDLAGRRPVLTDAGVFLAARSGEILDGVEALERDMRAFAAAQIGTLELGATITIGNYALPPQLARFRALYPSIAVNLRIANTADMALEVKRRRVQLALVEGAVDDPELDEEAYATDELTLVVPRAGHRLSGRASVSVPDLGGERFVAREEGSGTRLLADRVLRAAGLNPTISLSLTSGEGVARAVEAGLGIGILSHLVVERAAAAGRIAIVRISDVDLRRTFRIVSLRGRTLSPAAERFIDFLRADSPQAEVARALERASRAASRSSGAP